jgi:hypothetical protein
MGQRHHTAIAALLERESVRKAQVGERRVYAAVDIVRLLAETEVAAEYWRDLKEREPQLEVLSVEVEIDGPGGTEEVLEMLDLAGVLRVVQAIPSRRAEWIKRWLVETGKQRMAEIENPELAFLRAARLYQARGRGRQWIDKRLRGVSARRELTAEWRKRGVVEGEQYRQLTNDLVRGVFGMDVNEYRRFKNLTRPTENLRDHMGDLELALTTLAETAATELHRDRNSLGLDQLGQDVRAAGEIAKQTREAIEERSGRPVVRAGRFGVPPEEVREAEGASAPAAEAGPAERPGEVCGGGREWREEQAPQRGAAEPPHGQQATRTARSK